MSLPFSVIVDQIQKGVVYMETEKEKTRKRNESTLKSRPYSERYGPYENRRKKHDDDDD